MRIARMMLVFALLALPGKGIAQPSTLLGYDDVPQLAGLGSPVLVIP
jgi:hypothetical protein